MDSPTQSEPPPQQPPPPRASRWPAWLIVLGVVAAAAWFYFDRERQPVLLAGPMLQLTGASAGNRANAISIVWRAAPRSGEATLARGDVRWGGAAPAPDPAVDSSNGYCRRGFIDLPPNSEFSYSVANPGFLGRMTEVSPTTNFRTPPTPDKTFRFLAFGDSGNGSNTQRLVAERMMAANSDLIIHLGDLIYPAGSADSYRRNFFEPYRELLARVPFMPTLGNHDVATDKGQPYLDVFDLPRNGPSGLQAERNYYFDFGSARFVGLDTNRAEEKGAISEAQMREVVAPWLREVLTASKAAWKFVYFHHPPYTGSTHSASAQKFVHDIFVPVFESCGVDVVFSGHNHLYERTKPIRGDKIVAPGQGVVYIVSGAAGVSRYPEDDPPPDYIDKFNAEVFSFTQVDLSPSRFDLRQIDQSGNVLDRFTIEKSSLAAN